MCLCVCVCVCPQLPQPVARPREPHLSVALPTMDTSPAGGATSVTVRVELMYVERETLRVALPPSATARASGLTRTRACSGRERQKGPLARSCGQQSKGGDVNAGRRPTADGTQRAETAPHCARRPGLSPPHCPQ